MSAVGLNFTMNSIPKVRFLGHPVYWGSMWDVFTSHMLDMYALCPRGLKQHLWHPSKKCLAVYFLFDVSIQEQHKHLTYIKIKCLLSPSSPPPPTSLLVIITIIMSPWSSPPPPPFPASFCSPFSWKLGLFAEFHSSHPRFHFSESWRSLNSTFLHSQDLTTVLKERRT